MPSQFISVSLQAVIPDKNFTEKQFDNVISALTNYMKGPLTRRMKLEYKKTVENWDHAPEFVCVFSTPYGTRLELWTHPKGLYTTRWQRVSDGTNQGVITSRKKLMTFNVGFTPKTQPGGKYGGSGAKFGKVYYNRRSVGHSIPHKRRPRKFSEEVKKVVEKDINKEMQNVVKKALR